MKKISIHLFEHRGQQWLSVHFPYDLSINKLLRQIPEVRYSQSHRCWYFPVCSQKLRQLSDQLLTHDLQPDISAEVRRVAGGSIGRWEHRFLAPGHDKSPTLLDEFSSDEGFAQL